MGDSIRDAKQGEGQTPKTALGATAQPFISRLCLFLRPSGFFALLADAEGRVLSLVDEDGVVEEGLRPELSPGALLAEGGAAAKRLAGAAAAAAPVQVRGAEALIRGCGGWTCSAAPILGAAGAPIASLLLTGESALVHSHSLGMVLCTAGAIESTVALNAGNEAAARQTRFIETLVDSIKAGILSSDLDGRILSVNSQALLMFGYSGEEMLRLGMSALLPRWAEVRTATLSGSEFMNEDVLVDVRVNRLYYNLSTYPILGEEGSPSAVILVFKDLRKVRKHANEILGRRAVYTFDKIVGASPLLLSALDFAKKIADSRSTVLITGETGTGKEIFAQSIHNASPRREEPFVVLNCGAIPRTLIESELFGYADGAFTGAKRGGQAGKFEIADGGTIFLDEICEMPIDMQTRLLRVIEEGTVTRVGESRDIPVDVRIIAATNKDLAAEVAQGNFRRDLFYRLNVLPIRLPPLRERREDIPLLIEFYMDKIARKLNRRPVPMDGRVLAALSEREWPGNVRELENMIELVINSERPPLLEERQGEGRTPGSASLDEAEAACIRACLRETDNNITRSAKRLGIGRNTLYRKMERYGIAPGETGSRSKTEQGSPASLS
jgi:PAS domain S-box-containing protein